MHIDPYLTQSAQFLGGKWLPIKPGTDSALAIAIMHEWMVSGSYDKEYVASNTTGFDEWSAYVLGKEDGMPKTPEWQEAETGVPAKDVRSLARGCGRRRRPISLQAASAQALAGHAAPRRAPNGREAWS